MLLLGRGRRIPLQFQRVKEVTLPTVMHFEIPVDNGERGKASFDFLKPQREAL
jgi:hypothetical protein